MKIYGAKDAIGKAFNSPVRCPGFGEPPGGQGDNCGAIWDGIALGHVVKAVQALPDHCYRWAMYAYTDRRHPADEAQLLEWLADRLDDAQPVPLQSYGTMRPVLTTLLLVLQDAAHVHVCGRHLYSVAHIAGCAFPDLDGPAQRKRFASDRPYGRLEAEARRLIDGLDRDTLAPVAEVVAEIRERRAA